MLAKVYWTVAVVHGVIWFLVHAAPELHSKSWPPMKNYDIWDTPAQSLDSQRTIAKLSREDFYNRRVNYRESKVLNFFPVPVDDECLSEDGRRSGICLNVYECRIKGGTARGECALGFGVCCVFVASCDQEIVNNITHITSPNFPSSMANNMTSCKVKVKMMSPDISQLRIDFLHFSLGQPNRKTGVCDGDVFQLSGGLGGPFILCGQNSGQHVYYDVGGRVKERQAATAAVAGTADNNNDDLNSSFNASSAESPASSNADLQEIEILLNFTNRLLPTRLWEIRVSQIPFSQRAPAGCLQYFTGREGIIQTFNFADNGRHLANQNYKACIRQETDMCSIVYEPCDENSFRIGSVIDSEAAQSEDIPISVYNDPVVTSEATVSANPPCVTAASGEPSSSISAIPLQAQTTEATVPSEESLLSTTNAVVAETEPNQTDQIFEELEEGSGGGDVSPVSAAPTRGGFDILSFVRGILFDSLRRRSGRQIFSSCTDRITMPCIVEDFIGAGGGTIPDCEPVHCGNRFCSSATDFCRIESTVTPFYLGIHFGDGIGKGDPEDNIGACLKFKQMSCL